MNDQSESAGLKLEVGKRYVTRNGYVTTPLEPSDREMFPFLGTIFRNAGKEAHAWAGDGKFQPAIVGESPLDLVREYEDHYRARETASTSLRLEAGRYYATTDDCILGPMVETQPGIFIWPYHAIFRGTQWEENGKVMPPTAERHSFVREVSEKERIARGEAIVNSHPQHDCKEDLTPSQIGPDPINPSYYADGAIQSIDAIEEAIRDLRGPEAYLTGQVMKYLWRWKAKNGLEDLRKAQWYLERLIAKQEEGQP